MNWLAHHEFGQGHKPFAFGETGSAIAERGDTAFSPHRPHIYLQLSINQLTILLLVADPDGNPDRAVFFAYPPGCPLRRGGCFRLAETVRALSLTDGRHSVEHWLARLFVRPDEPFRCAKSGPEYFRFP